MALDEAASRWMEERWRDAVQPPAAGGEPAAGDDARGARRKLENRHGSAPGIWLEDDRGRWVAMLPGVPREMRGMLADTLLPRLAARVTRGTPSFARARCARPASPSRCSPIRSTRWTAARWAWSSRTCRRSPASTFASPFATRRERDAVDAIDGAAVRLRERAGAWIYGEDDDDLAAVVLQMCRSRGLTIGVAESCTGGLLGARLTAIPGSSDVVLGGVIAYHNVVKREPLGVSDASLAEHGAVSEQVVREMAAGARRVTGARVGLAITGDRRPVRRNARETRRHGLDGRRRRRRRVDSAPPPLGRPRRNPRTGRAVHAGSLASPASRQSRRSYGLRCKRGAIGRGLDSQSSV